MENHENSDLETFLTHYPPEIQVLARSARELIIEIMPGTIELTDPTDNLIAFGLDRGYKGLICGITLFSNHINIMLAQGASLPDPHGLLKGTGKLARHIRVMQAADLTATGVRDLLRIAYQFKIQG